MGLYPLVCPLHWQRAIRTNGGFHEGNSQLDQTNRSSQPAFCSRGGQLEACGKPTRSIWAPEQSLLLWFPNTGRDAVLSLAIEMIYMEKVRVCWNCTTSTCKCRNHRIKCSQTSRIPWLWKASISGTRAQGIITWASVYHISICVAL